MGLIIICTLHSTLCIHFTLDTIRRSTPLNCTLTFYVHLTLDMLLRKEPVILDIRHPTLCTLFLRFPSARFLPNRAELEKLKIPLIPVLDQLKQVAQHLGVKEKQPSERPFGKMVALENRQDAGGPLALGNSPASEQEGFDFKRSTAIDLPRSFEPGSTMASKTKKTLSLAPSSAVASLSKKSSYAASTAAAHESQARVPFSLCMNEGASPS